MNKLRVKPSFMILRTAAIILLFIFCMGCAVESGPILLKNGREYGRIKGVWGGNFWDYYRRGVSYSEGEFWLQAIYDFQQSAKSKQQDQRRVRTYGLHILDDYFPHREMGIAYYQLADYPKAIEELSLSLSCYPSAKANYYLNLSHEAYLRKTKQDITSPRIWITSHQDQQIVSGFETTLEGKAVDDWFVGQITINDELYPLELAQSDISFKTTLSLRQGTNEVRVVAKDLIGHEASRVLYLIADRQAPLLYIEDFSSSKITDKKGEFQEIEVKGHVKDLCGIKTFQINQESVPVLDKKGRFLFKTTSREHKDYLFFIAEDKLGNRVEGRLRLTDYRLEQQTFQGEIKLASLQLAAATEKDPYPPSISIDNPKRDKLSVDWEELFICGEVQDLGGIRDLLINDESILSQEGKKIYFNHILKLKKGKNFITIKAIDLSGNEGIKTLEIERIVHPIYEVGSRMSIAVIPFKYRGEDPEHKPFAEDHLINALVEQKRFLVVDREKIEQMLEGLTKGDNKADEPEASPMVLGRMVSAEAVLAGSIYENRGLVEIVARLIDTETSVILDTQDVYGAGDLKNLPSLLKGLALKFKQSFPLVEGMIIEKDGKRVMVNLGTEKNIKEFTKYIIFREEKSIKDPSSQQVWQRKHRILGEAKILRVLERVSEAELLKDTQPDMIKNKERVITK